MSFRHGSNPALTPASTMACVAVGLVRKTKTTINMIEGRSLLKYLLKKAATVESLDAFQKALRDVNSIQAQDKQETGLSEYSTLRGVESKTNDGGMFSSPQSTKATKECAEKVL